MDAPPRSDGAIVLTLVFVDGAVEEDDVIGRVRSWALRTAFVETPTRPSGHEDPPPDIGVSLSVKGPVDPQLAQAVRRTLATTDLEPTGLTTVEISETNVMADPAHTLRILGRLRDLGLPLAVDERGDGALVASLPSIAPIPRPRRRRCSPRRDRRGTGRLPRRAGVPPGPAAQRRVPVDAAEAREPRDELAWIGGDRGQGFRWSPALAEREVSRWLGAQRGSA